MASKVTSPTFCIHCKTLIVEEVLCVQKIAGRTFCSEKCVEEFYAFLVEFFAADEQDARRELGLENEPVNWSDLEQEQVFKMLETPDELWEFGESNGETIYSMIKSVTQNGQMFFLVALSYVFEGRPSFIFIVSATSSQEFVDHYRAGQQIKDIPSVISVRPQEVINLDKVDFENMEFLKGKVLAEILENHKPHDIQFEMHMNFQDYLPVTLSSPDEIYLVVDPTGDSSYYTHIKGFEVDGNSFYYIVFSIAENEAAANKQYLPFLGFPTLDPELCKYFRRGKAIKSLQTC